MPPAISPPKPVSSGPLPDLKQRNWKESMNGEIATFDSDTVAEIFTDEMIGCLGFISG